MSVIAPAAMCAVKLPPKGIFSVNLMVMSLFMKVCPVTVAPVLPLNWRSLSCTELSSTAWFQFTS